MRFPRETFDGFSRAADCTGVAADTLFRIDHVCQQGLSLLSAALLVLYVFHILVVEIVKGGKDRVRRSLSESAKRCVLDDSGKSLEFVQILHGSVSGYDLVQDFQHPLVSDTARSTFSAGFSHDEIQVETGY